MKLEELRIYQLAMELGEKIWDIVINWDNLSKETIGKQIIRAIDSVAANIAEGFGRYHFKERKHFLYYSRGSLYETKTFLTKAYNRKIIENNEYKYLISFINDLGIRLNNYINTLKE